MRAKRGDIEMSEDNSMRNISFTLLLVVIASMIASSEAPRAAERIRLAQTTAPVPLTLPSLAPGTQAFSTCQVGCGTQVQGCQNQCLSLASGASTSASVTIAGPTTNPTQCTLNCTTQQLVCQQSCAGLLSR